MIQLCTRCGIGQRDAGGPCDWCAAPHRPRWAFCVIARRALHRSQIASAVRKRGPLAAGIVCGVTLHLMAAVVGVAADIPSLWQMGFFWSEQWWWQLAPEPVQPWVFAAVRGAAYGGLAGWVIATTRPDGIRAHHREPGARGGETKFALLYAAKPAATAATITALAALVLTGWDPFASTQHHLVAAALGAAVGRMTTLVMRSQTRPAAP